MENNTNPQAKVLVYGKAQNRTALGIANAYLVINPNATLEDLNKAFPGSLNSSGRCETLFINVDTQQDNFKTQKEGKNMLNMFFFEKEDELMMLADGKRVAMQELWQKNDFEKIVEWAKQYGIVVADFKETSDFTKGGFRLEFINGFLPQPRIQIKEVVKEKIVYQDRPVEKIVYQDRPVEKIVYKDRAVPGPVMFKIPKWMWALLALLLIAIIILIFLLLRKPKETIVEKEVVKVETVTDGAFIAQLQEFGNIFNMVNFEKGSARLLPKSQQVLTEVAKFLKENENLKVNVVGHTSAEGQAKMNQRLSERRADSVVKFLVGQGVAADRMHSEGLGSSKLLIEENPMAPQNRRTEITLNK